MDAAEREVEASSIEEAELTDTPRLQREKERGYRWSRGNRAVLRERRPRLI
jgi:hypothetical protein